MSAAPRDAWDTFLHEHADRMAEVAWLGALAWLERAAIEARETAESRFRVFPESELSHLRHEVAGALSLARFAAAARRADQDLVHELMRDTREAANAAERRRRREQTLPAERARLAGARARREGRELTDAERFPWLVNGDSQNGRESS